MSVNIKLTGENLVKEFVPKKALRSYDDTLSLKQLADVAVTVTPSLDKSSPVRDIRWSCSVPVIATDAGKSTFEAIIDNILSVAGTLNPTSIADFGFDSGASLTRQLGKVITNTTRLYGGKFDSREISAKALQIEFERDGSATGNPIHYGYVVTADAAWLRQDHDDYNDKGSFRCAKIEDTLITTSGERRHPELPGFSGMFDMPLIAVGPITLPAEMNELALDCITVANCKIDTELFTDEFFAISVSSLRLKIYASEDVDFVKRVLNPSNAQNGQNGRTTGRAIERAAREIGRAVRDTAPDAVQGANARNGARRMIERIDRGELRNVRRSVANLPEVELRALAVELGVQKGDLIREPDFLTGELLLRLARRRDPG